MVQVPEQLKTSLITPIYKNGYKNLLHNYRPINLINAFVKLVEKCLKSRLKDFLEHKILH